MIEKSFKISKDFARAALYGVLSGTIAYCALHLIRWVK